jgi:thymidylate kinase
MNKSAADSTPRAPVERIGRSVALVGSDGAGKSTVAREVVRRLPFEAGYLYMGVNLEASPVMLPTTRVALALKRRRGGGTDMTVGSSEHAHRGGPLGTIRRLVRITNWIAEEAYRAVLARRIQGRGAVVVFDRHFFCDYYAGAIAPTTERRPIDTRIHGFVLDRWYPRPDLTLFLDAPPEVLVARKAGDRLERVARRRQEFLALSSVLPAFDVVDADRPLEAVVEEVVARIVAFVESGTRADSSHDAATIAPQAMVAPEPSAADADDAPEHAAAASTEPAATESAATTEDDIAGRVAGDIRMPDDREILVAGDRTGVLQMDSTPATGA